MKSHTLHVGINYTGTMSELRGCHNDARDFHRVAESFAATRTLLLGKNATRDAVVRAGERIKSRMNGEDDMLFVTWSSHGTWERDTSGTEPSGGNSALVCADFELFWDDEMGDLLSGIPLVFAVVDACHCASIHRAISGFLSSGAGPRRFRPRRRSIPMGKCNYHKSEGTKRQAALRNRWGIHGCGDGPTDYCYDAEFYGRPNGALSYYVMQLWKLLPTDATYRDLFRAVRQFLPSGDYPQTPALVGGRKNVSRPVPFYF